jgi:hypothetical protein
LFDCCVFFLLICTFLFFVYFKFYCFCPSFLLSTCILLYIWPTYLYIGYGLIPHTSLTLIFESTNKTSKLGGELTICPMTIDQGLGVWKSELISECLLGNGGHTCFSHSSQCSYTVFTKIVTRQIWDPFETRKKTSSYSFNE